MTPEHEQALNVLLKPLGFTVDELRKMKKPKRKRVSKFEGAHTSQVAYKYEEH